MVRFEEHIRQVIGTYGPIFEEDIRKVIGTYGPIFEEDIRKVIGTYVQIADVAPSARILSLAFFALHLLGHQESNTAITEHAAPSTTSLLLWIK